MPGTCEILEALTEKVMDQDGAKIFIVDLTVNRQLG